MSSACGSAILSWVADSFTVKVSTLADMENMVARSAAVADAKALIVLDV